MAIKWFQKKKDKVIEKMQGGGTSSPEAQQREIQENLSENRENAKGIIEALQTINIYGINKNKHFNDGDEQITPEERKKVEKTIRWAIAKLNEPLIISRNIYKFDEVLKSAADSLNIAIEEDLPNTLNWASTVLYIGLSKLRNAIATGDNASDDAYYESMLEYANSLKNIIEVSKKYDRNDKSLKHHWSMQNKKSEEVEQKKKELREITNSDKGMSIVNEIKRNAHNPSGMSEEAHSLKREYDTLHRLQANVAEICITIITEEAQSTVLLTQIDSIRIQLSQIPYVEDPDLEARIKRSEDFYREGLRKKQEEIANLNSMYETHLSKLKVLGNSRVIQNGMANVVNTINELEEEAEKSALTKYEDLMEARAAIERRRKSAERIKALNKDIEKAIEENENINIILNEDIEENKNTNVETETNVETVYEEDYE